MNRSVLLASHYNVWREPFNSQSQGFLSVIADVEPAVVLAPEGASYLAGHAVRPSMRYLLAETHHRVFSQLRIKLGRPGLSNMVETEINSNYDLFFFACQFPHELAALARFKNWRKRSGFAAAYILETWSSSLAHAASNLRLLNQFDHVFVLNEQSIPELRKYVDVPITFLAPATDGVLATPMPVPPQRTIEVYSYGRRSPAVHQELLQISRASRDVFYVYDSINGGKVKDWLDHRLLNASNMSRSKFFVAFNPRDVGAGARGAFRDEEALSTRYFEGAAGGAVMLGSKPASAGFDQYFDWPDALIPLSPQGGIRELLADLASQEDRLRTASHRNVVESLRRHDWSHRWAQILKTVGMEPLPALHERQAALRNLSEQPYP